MGFPQVGLQEALVYDVRAYGAVGQSFFVPAGGTITFTYSAAPTLVFVGN